MVSGVKSELNYSLKSEVNTERRNLMVGVNSEVN